MAKNEIRVNGNLEAALFRDGELVVESSKINVYRMEYDGRHWINMDEEDFVLLYALAAQAAGSVEKLKSMLSGDDPDCSYSY